MTQDPTLEPAPATTADGADAHAGPNPRPAHDRTGPDRTAGISRLRVGIVGGAALALAVGAVATSFAASPPASSTAGAGLATTSTWAAPAVMDGAIDGQSGGFDHGRFGGPGGFRDISISAISGSSLSLQTTDGWTRTIALTDAIELTKGGQAIALSDLAVGDEIRLFQDVAADGTVTVTGIAVVVPSVAGTVSDLTASSFKVTGRDGAVWTIALNGDTVYSYGAGDGSLADIAAGEVVHVHGTSTGDNALTATSVSVRGDLAMGTVTATTSNSITIEDRDGASVTIHVNPDTTYRAAGVAAATLADIAVGDVIGASGRARSDGSIDADAVMEGGRGFGPGNGGPGFGRGRGGHAGPGGFGPGFGPGPVDGGAEGTASDAG